MTALAVGASVTVAVRDGGTVAIATNGGMGSAVITLTEGGSSTVSLGPAPERRVFGPYAEGASLVLSNSNCGAFDYDVETRFDPSSVAITGGVIGGVSVDVLATASTSYQLNLANYSNSKPLMVAHAGGTLLAPEDTMEAFTSVLDTGLVYALENDIQTNASGSLVMMHDSTVDRTTGSTGAINTFTDTQWLAMAVQGITKLNIGGFGDVCRPPFFKDFLRAYPSRAITFNEVKDTSQAQAALDLAISFGAPRARTVFINSAIFALAAPKAAGYPTGYVTSTYTDAERDSALAAGVTYIILNFTAGQSAFQSYVAAGFKVLAWTIVRRNEADRAISWGAMGLICSDPVHVGRNYIVDADTWANGQWMPGQIAFNNSTTTLNRGSVQSGRWGWPSATTDLAGGSYQLWGAFGQMPRDNFYVRFKARLNGWTGTGQWATVVVNDAGESDNGWSGSGAQKGTQFLFRQNGSMEIFTGNGDSTTTSRASTGSSAPNAMTAGVDSNFEIRATTVNGVRTWSFKRMDSTYSTALQSISWVDTIGYGGGFINVGKSSATPEFSSVRIVRSF